MKKQLQHLKLFSPALIIIIALSSYAQEFTLTTTSANITSSKALIDLPGLSGNTDAIIIATPLGNTKTLNPHPNGAWYYSGKWNIFNSDHAAMIPGLTYKVQYFLTPTAQQFLHLVTQQNLGSEGSYIDNPALNNLPNVQFTIFQNHSPDVRTGSHLNQFEAKTGYSSAANKWYITNVAGQPLLKGSAYNIVITTGSPTNPPGPSPTQPCKCPVSLPPNGNAQGDLGGAYPNPTVQKLLGRPLSNTIPNIGQVLKWDGAAWVPADENGATSPALPPAPVQTFFKNGNNNLTVVPPGGILPLVELTHSVILSKKSRLVISGMIDISGDNCLTCSTSSQGWFSVNINGSEKLILSIDVPAKTTNAATISNFMIDLNPGNHNVKFEVKHSTFTSKLSVTARHSSIMVIPLE